MLLKGSITSTELVHIDTTDFEASVSESSKKLDKLSFYLGYKFNLFVFIPT